jgi:FMN phosphatase YigB (HAD superfamily)
MAAQKLELKLQVQPKVIRARSPRELLIFNLDDTLIDTSFYWLVRKARARTLTAAEGAPEGWDEKHRRYETASSSDSTMMDQIWRFLEKELRAPGIEERQMRLLISRVLRTKYPLVIPGADELLKWAETNFTLALLTSGDRGLQIEKLEAAKLAGYFKKIKAVPAKTTEEFNSLITEMAFSPRNTWVMGSSVGCDINPAIRAGAHGIRYTSPYARGTEEPGEVMEGEAFHVRTLPDARAILTRG